MNFRRMGDYVRRRLYPVGSSVRFSFVRLWDFQHPAAAAAMAVSGLVVIGCVRCMTDRMQTTAELLVS